MIDIEKAKEAFKEYVKNYDSNNPKIKTKIFHIQRVAINSRKIAQNLNLNEENIKLAELIGLLHDIGRFEQIKRYNTFVDKISINHGELWAKILFEDNKIRDFLEEDKYDKIIKSAIINHNKSAEEIVFNSKEEELHSKIVRDADKIDILNILTFEEKSVVWEKEDVDGDMISDDIYNEFINYKNINYKNIRTSADILVCNFAYIYDLNYEYSKSVIREKEFLSKIYNRFNFIDARTKERFKNIIKISLKYLEN